VYMETIIVKPKNAEEAKEVLDFLKKRKIRKEILKERTKEEVLDSIEQGAKDVARHLKGEIELKDARQLLNEL
jgi:Mg/Co/Ni transporter MgtE